MLQFAKLALVCCLALQLAKQDSIKDGSACDPQEMQILGMSLYDAVDAWTENNKLNESPIFSAAAECVALEREALERGTETAKSLKRELKCWRNLASLAADVSSTSSLQHPQHPHISLHSFWKAKSLEILRDHTALSTIDALWYRTWSLGILKSSGNIDFRVKQVRAGLEDPAFRCQSKWWQGFDSRHDVLKHSLWKRYAELLVAMQSLGASDVAETFNVATALPDNLQQWQTPQALHAQLPGLRASPLWDKSEFPWLLRLEEHFSDVHREILNAIQTAGLIENPDNFLHDKPDDWKSLALLLNGQWNEKICKHLTPVTCSILQNRPEFDSNRVQFPDVVRKAVAEGSFEVKKPATMVKVYKLQSGAYLRPHFGSHGRLAAHLGLSVPKDCCSLTVGGQQTTWEEGKLTVFDDAFVHEARNVGEEPRFVLGIFFVHPDLQNSDSRHMEL